MTAPTIPGTEPMSHVATGSVGVLVVHGFTGNPGSMRGLANAFVAAGFHVEMPQLAGHGTAVEDMVPTRWADWTRDADAAYARLAQRASKIVVAGLSMGGSITLWLATQHPELCGIICVNPATMPLPTALVDAVQGMLDSGEVQIEAIGSDIADPDVVEKAYQATPLAPLMSFQKDGLVPLSQRYGDIAMSLLLFTSTQDHVVSPSDSDALAATYGGAVERVILERSYHVATQDYDREIIFEKSVDFVHKMTA